MPLHQDEEAAAAIRAHHVELRDTLRARVGDQRDAVRAGRPQEESEHAVMGYLEDDLLPHAAAEEARLRRWFGVLFGLSSIITPFFLGAIAGAIASGRVPVGNAVGDPLSSWFNPTSILGGRWQSGSVRISQPCT